MTHHHLIMNQLFGTIEGDADQVIRLFGADRFGFANIFADAASDAFSLTKIDPLLVTCRKQSVGGAKLGTVAAVGAGRKIDLFVKEKGSPFRKRRCFEITHHLFERVFEQNPL